MNHELKILNERREYRMQDIKNIIKDIVVINNLEIDNIPEEYVNEKDGLLYCKSCNTPKEKEIMIFGEQKKVHINCKCRQEEIEKERKEEEKYQHDLTVKRLKRDCFEDPILFKWCFSNMDEDTEHKDIARNYVSKFNEIYKNNMGIILTGDVGCGKLLLQQV